MISIYENGNYGCCFHGGLPFLEKDLASAAANSRQLLMVVFLRKVIIPSAVKLINTPQDSRFDTGVLGILWWMGVGYMVVL